MNRIITIVVAALLVFVAMSSSLFVVDQRQVAVIKTLGRINDNDIITSPGLNFNWPLVQTVSVLDKRVQTLDSPEARAVFTAEKKSLIIDWLVKWRINRPRDYIRNSGVDQHNLEGKLAAVVQAAFNEEITKHTVRGVLSDERDTIMTNVQKRLVSESKDWGIEIVDVRIKRVDFVADITDAVYQRMKSERKQVANQLRAEGKAEQERIQADADRQRAVIVAQATVEAQKVKGEADAQASSLYADAFGRDARFAAFYRSLDAYRASFRSKSDVLVVDSSSEFFKAMRGAGAGDDAAPARGKH